MDEKDTMEKRTDLKKGKALVLRGHLAKSKSAGSRMWLIPDDEHVERHGASELRAMADDAEDQAHSLRLRAMADYLEKTISDVAPAKSKRVEVYSDKRLADAWNVEDRTLRTWISAYEYGGTIGLVDITNTLKKKKLRLPVLASEILSVLVWELVGPALDDLEAEMRARAEGDCTSNDILEFADKLREARIVEVNWLEPFVKAYEEYRRNRKPDV